MHSMAKEKRNESRGGGGSGDDIDEFDLNNESHLISDGLMMSGVDQVAVVPIMDTSNASGDMVSVESNEATIRTSNPKRLTTTNSAYANGERASRYNASECYIHNVESTAFLLSMEDTTEADLNSECTRKFDTLRLATHKNSHVTAAANESYLHPSSAAVLGNHHPHKYLKSVENDEAVRVPMLQSNKTSFNSLSQSSMDTRLNNGKNFDLIPLMPLLNNGDHLNRTGEAGMARAGGMAGGGGTEEGSNGGPQKWYIILLQVLLPFFIAGFGMVAAGVVLDLVQHWELFKQIPAIFTLYPALLGLKGNLEMTLASRFSTQVNIGKIKDKSSILSAVLGNFALTQAQAIIVGFLASVGAFVINAVSEKNVDLRNGLVLIAGSMSTASFASLLLAGLMMFVIIASKRLNINPDNVATPIAASLGDLVTLSILSGLGTFLYQIKSFIWIQVSIIVIFLILVPIFFYYASRNEFARDALYNGWTPIIIAMIISSVGGYIMGYAVQVYSDIAVFQPVVNGVGGNLVAIFASRLSTALHSTSDQGTKASWAPMRWYFYVYDTFLAKSNPEANTACVLTLLAVPGHLLFFFTITQIKLAQNQPINPATQTPLFVSFYISLLILQVILLMLICYWLVHLTWSLNKNPDNVCIPYLTAIGDFLGTAFLAICFHTLYLLGETGLRDPH